MKITVQNAELFCESTLAVQAFSVAQTLRRPIRRVFMSKHHHDIFCNTINPGKLEGRAILANLSKYLRFELLVVNDATESVIEFGLVTGFHVLNPRNNKVATVFMRSEFTVEILSDTLRGALSVEPGMPIGLVDQDGQVITDLNMVPNGAILELRTKLLS